MSNGLIIQNRKARFSFQVLETLEVGIALVGTEVKSLRAGKVHIHESYIVEKRGELYLQNANIAWYDQGNQFNHDPMRLRKLLLHKREITRLGVAINQKGLTLVPLKMYFKGRHIKLEIGLCKGKDQRDKRQDKLKAQAKKEMARAIKNISR